MNFKFPFIYFSIFQCARAAVRVTIIDATVLYWPVAKIVFKILSKLVYTFDAFIFRCSGFSSVDDRFFLSFFHIFFLLLCDFVFVRQIVHRIVLFLFVGSPDRRLYSLNRKVLFRWCVVHLHANDTNTRHTHMWVALAGVWSMRSSFSMLKRMLCNTWWCSKNNTTTTTTTTKSEKHDKQNHFCICQCVCVYVCHHTRNY